MGNVRLKHPRRCAQTVNGPIAIMSKSRPTSLRGETDARSAGGAGWEQTKWEHVGRAGTAHGSKQVEHAECAGTAHGNATATVDDAPRCTVRIHYASKSDPL